MNAVPWLSSFLARPWFLSGEVLGGGVTEPDDRPEPTPGPQLVPQPDGEQPRFPLWAALLMLLIGAVIGAALWSAGENAAETAQPTTGILQTVKAERTRFSKTVRVGGTVGATNFAMIRAPRMRGGRDRGGPGGSSSLTIESLAEPGSIVEKGEVVAQFESRRTGDILADYESTLAQTKAMVGTRTGDIMIATETVRQEQRTAKAEAGKAELDVRTVEVKSEIEAEILRLLAEEGRVTAKQLEQQVKLQEQADAAELRSLEISVAQDEKRLERTEFDLDKMKLRTPVGGLVVIETVFQRGNFAQAAPGDEVRGGSYFMRVVDLSKMAVFANLNQVDSQMVRMGARVQVQLDAYPEVVFDGRVASVGAMAVSGGSGRRGPPGSSGSRGQWVKQVAVEIEILGEDERISPDLSASADILVEQQEDALVVPRAAIDRRGQSTVVWLRSGDTFVEREVELGAGSDTQVVILAGLDEGDEIAAQPPASHLASR